MLATSKSGERSRRWLQERIWGSRERANSQASLRRELSNLRPVINVAAKPLLIIGHETVALDLEQIIVDVRDPIRISESREEFLEGIDIAWEEGFEDWLREERQAIDSARESADDLVVGERPAAPAYASQHVSGRPAISIIAHEQGLAANQAAIVGDIAGNLAEHIACLRWLTFVGASAVSQRIDSPSALVHVGKLLSVEYLLCCQLAGGEVITITLHEASSGRVLWSSRHDLNQPGHDTDIKRITIDAVAAASSRIEADQADRVRDRPIDELNSDELLWRARWHKRRFTRNDAELTEDLLERAAAKARPGTVDVIIEQAEAEASRIWATATMSNSLEALRDRVVLARDIDPYDARAWLLLGVIDMWRGQHDSAAALMHEVLALDPSHSPGYAQLGTCYILSGHPNDGVRLIRTALRLNPQDGRNFHRFGQLALANLMLDNHCEAVVEANNAIARRPGYVLGHVYRTAALWLNGDHEGAKFSGARLLAAKPDYNPDALMQLPFRHDIWNEKLHASVSAALRDARQTSA